MGNASAKTMKKKEETTCAVSSRLCGRAVGLPMRLVVPGPTLVHGRKAPYPPALAPGPPAVAARRMLSVARSMPRRLGGK